MRARACVKTSFVQSGVPSTAPADVFVPRARRLSVPGPDGSDLLSHSLNAPEPVRAKWLAMWMHVLSCITAGCASDVPAVRASALKQLKVRWGDGWTLVVATAARSSGR